jgi:RES domain-containing protein
MASELPADWDAIPAGHTSIRLGSSWYHAQRSALLEVPSAIVPEESAVLIHCRHPDTAQIALRALRKYSYESLLGR